MQPTLFDDQLSEAAKVRGMEEAAKAKKDLLAYARKIAVEVAESRQDRTCNADDVQAVLEKRGIGVLTLGNAAGSLFRGGKWVFTGRFVKSARIHAHKNLLRVWRYIG